MRPEEDLGDGVISVDPTGRVVFLNRAAEQLTGWSHTEAAGRSLSEVFHVVGDERGKRLIARDARERPIDDSRAPVRDAAGALVGEVVVFRDVSDRRLAEEAQAQLAAIVESSDDAIVGRTLDGIIRSWNTGAERIFGYTRDEAVGRPITMLLPADRSDEEAAILARLRRGERIEHFETVRVAKDGRKLDISLTVSPIRDRHGRIIAASKIARDITARRRAERDGALVERELAGERERLRITLASIGDAVISTDAQGRVAFMNNVAETLTGRPLAEAVGRPLGEVFHIVNEVTRAPVANPAQRALAEGRTVGLANHTVLIARDGSERPIDDSAAPMRDAAGALIGVVLVFRDVSERTRAEEARARLAAIVESSDDAIVSKTLDGVIRSWNAAAERLFGHTAQEAIGQPITILIPPERLAEEAAILARLRAGERVDHFETVRVTKDGRALDISLTVSPIRDAAGRIIGASKVARDISDRRRADRALRESEGRHRFLSELATATQHITDPDEIMATTARRLAEHLDVDRCVYAEVADESRFVITGDCARGVPSMVGTWPIADFGAECLRAMRANEPFVVDDVDADARAGAALEVYRKAQIQALICVPLHKLGKLSAAMAVHRTVARHWTAAEIELVRTVAGRSWESLERARVARGLFETAERLALVLAAARLGDWSWDGVGDALTLSPRAREILGGAAGSSVAWRELLASLHPDDREPARAEIARAVTQRAPVDVEYRVRHADGREVWVSARGRAQSDARGRALGMFGVVQDVTEKKRLEHELRQRARELADADRQKDDFIALLAHELRNPLAPIRTALHVMQLASTDVDTVERARATMDRQLSHLVRLIDDLLDVSRINRNKLHLHKARVALGEVLRHAVEAAAPVVEAAGHDLSVSLPPEPVLLDADLTRLTQVFGNLLSNSAKYTPRGGRIAVSAELRGREAVVSVRDNGIGIPAESLPRVFEMFAQVDRAAEHVAGGLGIGLALVKGLVEMHGGSVSAHSAGVGAGSTFTVRLPIAAPAAEHSPPPGAAAPSAFNSARTVLVVDDYRDGAASMATLLEILGNQVHVAHDGVEAVELAERVLPDLILMDVGMPRMNGLEAARRIRERPWGRDVVIVALTGWGQEADRARTKDAGFDGHLVKPLNLTELQQILALLPKRGSPAQLGGRISRS